MISLKKQVASAVVVASCVLVLHNASSLNDAATKIMIKWRIRNTTFELVKDNKSPDHKYIDNVALEQDIMRCLDYGSQEGGLFVFGGPQHSGKSTHLQEIIPKFIKMQKQKGNHDIPVAVIHLDKNELNILALRSKLDIPEYGELEAFLPANTLIIIDLVNANTLDDKSKHLLTVLATTSRNSKIFFVVVCVSNPSAYKDILSCNGTRKVYPLCNPELLQIGRKTQSIDAFISIYNELYNSMDIRSHI